MTSHPPPKFDCSIASKLAAPQHRPRPLPVFLDMLRSETAHDPARMRAALAGLKAYQNAPRRQFGRAGRVVGAIGRVSLLSYGNGGRPILFVPSLINGSEILDLTPENSLMRGLAEAGLDPVLLDWGSPCSEERDLDIAGHVERYIVAALALMGPDTVLAGYCLGGTMSLAAATVRRPRAMILIAAPWDFAGFPSQTRDELMKLWSAAEPAAAQLGLLPAELLQQVFWRIDPARTIAKFEQFATKDPLGPEGQNYVAVEDWANAGPPLTLAAGRELMVDMMHANVTGEGRWKLSGSSVYPDGMNIPLLNVLSTTDRITPAASAWRGGERVALDEGHVGMIVGRRAPSSLWARLRDWIHQL